MTVPLHVLPPYRKAVSPFLLLWLMLLPGTALANAESFWGAQEFYTAKGHVRYLLLFPPHYDPHRHYELWLNLHGDPGCASHAIFQYREPAQQREVFLLAPQANGWSGLSYERPDGTKDVYRAWDKRKDRARIWAVLDEVQAKYPISAKRIALLGFSAGCGMGWRLLADRPTTFYFFGGVANGFKGGKPPVPEALLRRAARHVPHFYGVGKSDGFADPMFAPTVRRLRAEGFELRTAHPAGVGHDLPPSIKTPLLAFMDEVRARQKETQTEKRNPVAQQQGSRIQSKFTVYVGAGVAFVSLSVLGLLLRRRFLR